MMFYTLASKIDRVRLVGTQIQGRWESGFPARLPGDYRFRTIHPTQLVQTFANWASDPEAIVKFTKKYGSLIIPAEGRGRTFSFLVNRWQAHQRRLRAEWMQLMPSSPW
jgi:hypothetical protein